MRASAVMSRRPCPQTHGPARDPRGRFTGARGAAPRLWGRRRPLCGGRRSHPRHARRGAGRRFHSCDEGGLARILRVGLGQDAGRGCCRAHRPCDCRVAARESPGAREVSGPVPDRPARTRGGWCLLPTAPQVGRKKSDQGPVWEFPHVRRPPCELATPLRVKGGAGFSPSPDGNAHRPSRWR